MTVRRLKTYAGSQGYVYQYYFVGKRPAAGPLEATEYIFDVTSDRKLSHRRPLGDSEQYAAVKLRLFRAFDEVEDMQSEGRQLGIDAPFLEEALASLGVE
jgi:hypothetical protein